MKFWKMNGAGNDFIIINNIEEKIPVSQLGHIAAIVCERHLSIGADGLIAVEKANAPGADIKMLFFDSDGSEGEMCGNGARCICRYAYENGFSGDHQVIETKAGIVTGERLSETQYKIKLNDPGVVDLERKVKIDGNEFYVPYIELGDPGVPHAMLEIKNLMMADEEELRKLGKSLRSNPAFPKGANINFFEIIGEDRIYERTYERGVEDFTYACGTGTACVVYLLKKEGSVSGQDVRVSMRGGDLIINIDDNGIFLTGPTKTVCKGEAEI